MIRKPTKTLSGSTVLPRGMCIDLSQSGVGPSGAEFAVGARIAPTAADRFGPLFIVFNSRGSVDGVYYRQHIGTSYSFNATSPTSVMHILVGRTEQVVPTGGSTVPEKDGFAPNLYDIRNVWVSINPFNGAIHTAPNAAFAPSTSLVPAVAGAADRASARVFAINALDARGSN
jgi:hypothetical protein